MCVAVTPNGNHNSMKQIVQALQWFANHNKHTGGTFSVDSPVVEEAINSIAVGHNSNGGTGNPSSGPCLGLKDALSWDDRLRMMRYIYGHRADWAAASVSFVYGHNGAVRGASNRSLVLSDLNLSYAFGPDRTSKHMCCLLVVIRKEDVHKDHHDNDRQVAFWRHRDYLLCSVFATAAHILTKLQRLELKFLQPNRRIRPNWMKIPFMDWDNYDGT